MKLLMVKVPQVRLQIKRIFKKKDLLDTEYDFET